MTTIRVIIAGRVQGVWFRGWTIAQAEGLGLSGWVRNRRDGSVEALFHGPELAVREMVARCRQGPPAAAVIGVTERLVAEPAPTGFRQLPTGFRQLPTA